MSSRLVTWWRSLDEGAWIFGSARFRGFWLVVAVATASSAAAGVLFGSGRSGWAAVAYVGAVLVCTVVPLYAARAGRVSTDPNAGSVSLKYAVVTSLLLVFMLVFGAILLLVIVVVGAIGR